MDCEYSNNGSEWEEGDAEEILIVTTADHNNAAPQQRHSTEELARSDLHRTAMDFAERVRAVPGARAGAAAPGTGEVERLTAQECRVAGVPAGAVRVNEARVAARLAHNARSRISKARLALCFRVWGEVRAVLDQAGVEVPDLPEGESVRGAASALARGRAAGAARKGTLIPFRVWRGRLAHWERRHPGPNGPRFPTARELRGVFVEMFPEVFATVLGNI